MGDGLVGGGPMAAAPYIYPGWGNPPAPSTVMSATGIECVPGRTRNFAPSGAAAIFAEHGADARIEAVGALAACGARDHVAGRPELPSLL